MKHRTLIRISQAILAIGIIVWAIGCLVNMVDPQFTKGIFEHYVEQSWDTFVAEQPRQATLYNHLIRMAYVYWQIGAAYALFILLTNYGRRDRSAWVILLAGTIAWGCVPLIFGLVFSDPAGVWLGIVSLTVSLVALAVGAKPIWSGGGEGA